MIKQIIIRFSKLLFQIIRDMLILQAQIAIKQFQSFKIIY
jgi:hypothetical protein